MDTPTSAATDEKTTPSELALATQPGKSEAQEKSKSSNPLEISAERMVRAITFSSLYAGISTATWGR